MAAMPPIEVTVVINVAKWDGDPATLQDAVDGIRDRVARSMYHYCLPVEVKAEVNLG